MKIQSGFTLIEMMIVVAIIAILAMVATYAYRYEAEKSRLAEAKVALLQDGQFLERFYADNGRYTKSSGALALPTLPKQSTDFYLIHHSTLTPLTANGSYSLVAIPKSSIAASSKYYLKMNQNSELRKCPGVIEAPQSPECPVY